MDSYFEVLQADRSGRRGRIRTAHGVLETPFFMPDATRAAVRGIEPGALASSGIEALVVNTYHLLLRPGAEHIARMGGVHAFMCWDAPILSDSGGYQVYSLIHKHPECGLVSEEGALFRSPIDGSKYLLTPERAIDIQFDLGVDMMVCLDDPRPNDAPTTEAMLAVERTLRWARRCKIRYEERLAEQKVDGNKKQRPLLFSVVQGGMDMALRRHCAEALAAIGFDGYGFGARHLDMAGNFLEEVLHETAACIPEDAIRFALGVGTPQDIVRCHSLGWDIFDCVIPTREGRHGRAFLRCAERSVFDESFYEVVNLTSERFRGDKGVIDEMCDCAACAGGFSRAYIRHLFATGEVLGSRLLSLHNLRFYATLMDELRGRSASRIGMDAVSALTGRSSI